jgi:hypothetical protein
MQWPDFGGSVSARAPIRKNFEGARMIVAITPKWVQGAKSSREEIEI